LDPYDEKQIQRDEMIRHADGKKPPITSNGNIFRMTHIVGISIRR